MTRRTPATRREAEPKFEPCVNCFAGWTGTHEADARSFFGVRMTRCVCWKAHKERLEQLRAERGEQ